MTVGQLIVEIVGKDTGLTKELNKAETTLKKVGNTAKQVSLYVSTPLALLGTTILNVSADFEKSMNRVKALTGATGDEIDKLTARARELGKDTEFSASQAAEAMSFFAMAGFNTEKIYDVLPDTLNLASAAQLDLGQSADIVSNIMSGFGIQADELAKTVDVLTKQFTSSNTDLSQLGEGFKYVGPIAKGLGASFEETSAALGILSDAGIQGSAAGTGLRRVYSTLAAESKKLGIQTLDDAGKLRPLYEIVADLEKQGLTTAEALEIFGDRGGPAIAQLLATGSDTLKTYTERLQDVDGIAKSIAETQMEGLTGEIKILKSAFQEFQISLGNEIIPTAVELVKKVTEIINKFSSWDTTTKKIVLALSGLAIALPPIVTAITSATTAFLALNPAVMGIVAAIGLLTAAYIAVQEQQKKAWQEAEKFVEKTQAAYGTGTKTVADYDMAIGALSAEMQKAQEELDNYAGSTNLQTKYLEGLIKQYENEINILIKQRAKVGQNSKTVTENTGATDDNTGAQENNTGAIEENTDFIDENSDSIEENTDIVEENTSNLIENFDIRKKISDAIDTMSSGENSLGDIVDSTTGIIVDQTQALNNFGDAVATVAGEVEKTSEKVIDLSSAVFDNFSNYATPAIQDFFEQLTTGQDAMSSFKDFLTSLLSGIEQAFITQMLAAIASTLFPFSPVQFASNTAFLAAGEIAIQGAKAIIASLGDGGIVRGNSGGQLYELGERGVDEAVIPLSNSDAIERIADKINAGIQRNSGYNINSNINNNIEISYKDKSLAKFITAEIKNKNITVSRKALVD